MVDEVPQPHVFQNKQVVMLLAKKMGGAEMGDPI